MADRKLASVPVTLGGKKRLLVYDVNAFIALSEELHVNLMTAEGWETVSGKLVPDKDDPEKKNFEPPDLDLKQVRAIVWAGLLHDDDALTLRQVGAWLDPMNLYEIYGACMKAWRTQDVTEEPEGSQAPLDEKLSQSAASS